MTRTAASRQASRTSSKRRSRPLAAPPPRGGHGTRRRYAGWVAAGAAAVLAVVLVWFLVDGTRERPVASDGAVESFTHVHGLQLPGWAPGTVFLSTHQGLIRIQDGRWRYVGEQHHDFMGFAADPTQPEVLYSSGHPAPGSGIANPVGFMVSTDGGLTWEVRALEGQVDFHAMSVGASGEAIYGWNTAGQPGFYRSRDRGHTWQVVDAAGLQTAGGALGLAAHPEHPNQAWAGTPTGLLHTRDAGDSWQTALPGVPVTAVAFDPADADRMLAYAADPGAGLLESTDGGGSWSPLGWQLDDTDDAAGHLVIDPTNPDTIYLGTYGEDLLRTTDTGRTWQTLARDGIPDPTGRPTNGTGS